jgi:nicotinate-nucleotide pyrophosphorylase (carboxylating)
VAIPFRLNHIDSVLIQLAFQEDFGMHYPDPTSQALFQKDYRGRVSARIISKHASPILFCGAPLIKGIIAQFVETHAKEDEDSIQVLFHVQDGEIVLPGATCVALSGPAVMLMMLERTILNFLQRLSAIATLTQQFVKRVSHTRAQILDTRKTTPGMRHLAKYAVLCGGGVNHRMGLYDAMMIKDTHVDLMGGMKQVMTMLSTYPLPHLPIIVEVRTMAELDIVLSHDSGRVGRILLDNMTCNEMKKCVSICQGRVATEASGNVTLNTVSSIAETGVDFISAGYLTHSAGNIDLSMKCDIS